MIHSHSAEFRRDAIRMALTSGLSRRQVASELGIGISTLNSWVKNLCNEEVVSCSNKDLSRENERLRRDNRVLSEKVEVLRQAIHYFAEQG